MKTNAKMPVFGVDAVHAQYIDGELRLFLGESKLYKLFKSAATSSTASIAKAIKSYDHEFSLIKAHINFPDMDASLKRELISKLNPFKNTQLADNLLHSPCFIGFAAPECFLDEESYLSSYKKLAIQYIDDYFSKLKKHGIHHSKTTLFMLPFSSIKDLVKKFILHMGIK